MASVRSRRSEPSTAARMSSGRLLTPVCVPSSSKAKPNLVAMTTSSRTGCEASPDELLVVERAVDLGGVEQGDAPVHRGAEEGDHLLPWWPRTERLAHAHAAEAEGGHLQAVVPRVRACIGGSPSVSFAALMRRVGRVRLRGSVGRSSQGDDLRLRAAALAGVEGVDRGELVGGELEVEDVEVLRDPVRLGRLRDHRAALLQVPAQHHLGRGLAVRLGDAADDRVLAGCCRGSPSR